MDKLMAKYPMFLVTCSLVAGIFLGMSGVNSRWCFVPILVALIVYVVLYKKGRTPAGAVLVAPWHSVWVALFFVAIGILSHDVNRPDDVDFASPEAPALAFGEIDEVMAATSGDRLIVRVDGLVSYDNKQKIYLGNTYVHLLAPPGYYEPHDKIVFRNHLERVVSDPNRQTLSRIPAAVPVAWRMTLREGDFVLTQSSKVWYTVHHLRDKFMILIDHCGVSRSTASFLQTLLIGRDDNVSDSQRTAFQDAGLSHILAVSGLHMGIIAALIYLMTIPLTLCGARRWRYAIVTLLTWCYVLLAGCHISAVRAALMVSLVMIGKMAERKNYTFNSLCVAILVILFIHPRAILDIGFQLSVLCVSALVLFSDYTSLNDNPHSLISRIYTPINSSILAVGASWPVTAYYFRIFPTMFIPVNLLVLPILPAYLLLSLLHLVFCASGLQLFPIAWMLDTSYSLLVQASQWLTLDTVLHFGVSAATPLLWIVAGCALLLWLKRRKRVALIAAGFLASASISCIWLIPTSSLADGVIVGKSANAVAMTFYQNGVELRQSFPLGRGVAFTAAGQRVVVTGKGNVYGGKHTDVLVITRAAVADCDRILQTTTPAMVVIHPSVRKKLVPEIRQCAEKHGAHVWNIRDSGPLRLLDGADSDLSVVFDN